MDHAPMNWLKLYTLILCSDSIYIMFIYFTYRFVVKVTCSNTFNDFLISVASPLWLIIYILLRLSCSYVLTRIMDHALMNWLNLYTLILCSDSIYSMFIYFTYRFVVNVTCSNTFNEFLISVTSPLWLII